MFNDKGSGRRHPTNNKRPARPRTHARPPSPLSVQETPPALSLRSSRCAGRSLGDGAQGNYYAYWQEDRNYYWQADNVRAVLSGWACLSWICFGAGWFLCFGSWFAVGLPLASLYALLVALASAESEGFCFSTSCIILNWSFVPHDVRVVRWTVIMAALKTTS